MDDIIKKYPFSVIYEDNHLLVVNKPSGLLCQGDSTGDKPIAELGKDYLKEKYNKPGNVFCGVTHRLDRPVSGALVLARTSKALERMNSLFKNRDIQKTYWAIVKNKPKKESGRLVHYLVKDGSSNTVKAHQKQVEGSKKAELTYQLVGYMNDHYLLEVSPITGRAHQIRVQLAAMGCPIKGDTKYGFKQANPDKSIHLHARRIEFIHPVKKDKLLLIAPVPENQFWEQFLDFDKKVRNRDLKKLIKET